jgi:hypothetical protein
MSTFSGQHTAPVIRVTHQRFVIKIGQGEQAFRKHGGKEVGAETGRFGWVHTSFAIGIVKPECN